MNDVVLIFCSAVVLLMVAGSIWARWHEKKEWNNGICRQSKTPWRHYDTDSQGGRMYIDATREYYCDISYKVDRVGIKS